MDSGNAMFDKQSLLKVVESLPDTANWHEITDALLGAVARRGSVADFVRPYRAFHRGATCRIPEPAPGILARRGVRGTRIEIGTGNTMNSLGDPAKDAPSFIVMPDETA
jgi:hypothetical protein